MNDSFNPTALRLRLLLLTALVVVLGFVFGSQFSDKSSYSDDTARFRVAEVQAISVDFESPLQDNPPRSFVLSSNVHIVAVIFGIAAIFFSEFTPRLTFFYHVRPRSPPLH